MKKFASFFLIALISFSAHSQKKWSLRECIEQALENNISVKQTALEVENADIEKMDAIGNFLPSLNASASNSWNTGLTQNITTGVLETQTSRNSSYNLSVGLTIFNGLKNIRALQRAKLSQLAAQYNLDKMEDDIALFVANNYLQVLLNKANLRVIQTQNEVTQQQLKRTNDLVDAGVLPRGDLLEIEATNASEKQRIAIAENAVTISLISLAQLILVKDYANFDVSEEEYQIIDGGFSNKTVEEVIAAAKENRYEVKIAEQNVAISLKDLELAKSNYLPTLRGFFNYNTRESGSKRLSQSIDPDNPTITSEIGIVESTGESVIGTFSNTFLEELNPLPFIEQLYLNDGISYGVSLNIPIFNGFSVRNNVKRSQVNVKRNEYQLEQATLDLESKVYQAYVDTKGALKSYEAAVVALESQKLAYQYAKDRYDVGLTNAFDFSQSKQRYDNAQIEENRAKYDYIFKLKVLELYFGVPATELKF
ncbi:MAG: TolC family protein [Flavobacteriales bacterium]